MKILIQLLIQHGSRGNVTQFGFTAGQRLEFSIVTSCDLFYISFKEGSFA